MRNRDLTPTVSGRNQRQNRSSVQKLLSFVKSTLKWRLMDRKPLDTWVHPKGRLVLLGDAGHPVLVCRF